MTQIRACEYTTHYYDCSYCDENSEEYYGVTESGKRIGITKARYHTLLKRWNTKPIFVELDRHIVYHGSCGKDGDEYYIEWDKKLLLLKLMFGSVLLKILLKSLIVHFVILTYLIKTLIL